MPAITASGLAALDRAFGLAGKNFRARYRADLKRVAEPVRVDAERRAVAAISNIGEPWSRMRSVARTNVVYVAPVQRGRQSRQNPNLRRPNLARLLMDKAMQPALDTHAGEVAAEFDRLLVALEHDWESV